MSGCAEISADAQFVTYSGRTGSGAVAAGTVSVTSPIFRTTGPTLGECGDTPVYAMPGMFFTIGSVQQTPSEIFYGTEPAGGWVFTFNDNGHLGGYCTNNKNGAF